MVKALSLLPLLSLMAMPALSPLKAPDFRSYLTTEDNPRNQKTLTGVDPSFTGDELRIYHYKDLPIDEISDNAFLNTTFESLMMSNFVTEVSDAVFDNALNIKYMHYTGSPNEYAALGLTHSFTNVQYYAYDEGFINYWNEKIRPNAETNICEISNGTFQEMYNYYRNLQGDDLETVKAYKDAADVKIEDSIKELLNHFRSSNQSQKTEEWNQTGAITLIIFIAVIGMTSITIFFLLKTRNIIQ